MSLYMGVEDVGRQIGISPSTVKKYYLLLEKSGYKFNRSKQGHLLFSSDDLELFRILIEEKNKPGMTLERAMSKVVTVITGEPDNNTPDLFIISDNLQQIKEAILLQQKSIDIQSDQISRLVKENNESKKMIENNISSRDDLLMKTLNETMEVKRLLLKKKWWQLWK